MGIQTSAPLKRLKHLQGETSSIYHKMSSTVGVSDSVMHILYTICNYNYGWESCLLRDICNLSGLPKQTINSALRKLEEGHIVFLEAVGSKNKRVILTEEGKKLASQTAEKVIEAENRIFDEWGAENAETFLALNERYVNDSVIKDLASKFPLIPDILFPPFENKSASCNTHNTEMSSPDNPFTDMPQTDGGHSYVLHSAQKEYHQILLDDISLFVMQMLLVLFDMQRDACYIQS